MDLKEHNRISELVSSRFKLAKDFQEPYFTDFIEYYQLYRNVRNDDQQSYVGRANLSIPTAYQTVETILPRMVGARPSIDAVPREATDITKADKVTQLFDYQWDRMDMKRKLKMWVKGGLIYGIGIIKLTWAFKGEWGNEVDQPNAEVVDIFDMFIDPDATCIQDADYVINRVYRNIEELKDNDNYDVPKELVAEVSKDDYKVQRDAIMGVTKVEDKDKKKVELFEYWGKCKLDGEEKECLIVVANRKYVIRAQENPFKHGRKPFIAFVDTPMPNEFWPIGEIEMIRSLIYEKNDNRNQRMDNVSLILNKLWKVLKGGNVDESELVSRPGGIVHVGDMNALEPIVTPDVTTSSYNEETIIDNDTQKTTGINDYFSGFGGQGVKGQQKMNETATGALMMQEAGNSRIRYKLDNLEDSLREFGEQLLALDQQFLSKKQVVRVTGEGGFEWNTISVDEIKGGFDIEVDAGVNQPMSKSMRRAEARELIQTIAPFLNNPQSGVALKYFLKHLLETYDLTNLNEAFAPVPTAPIPQAPGVLPIGRGGRNTQEPGMEAPKAPTAKPPGGMPMGIAAGG